MVVIHMGHKLTMLADISNLENRMSRAYTNGEKWSVVEDVLAKLRKMVENAPEEGEEGELDERRLHSERRRCMRWEETPEQREDGE